MALVVKWYMRMINVMTWDAKREALDQGRPDSYLISVIDYFEGQNCFYEHG